MTVREIAVWTMVAPSSRAISPYRRSIHQSASLRASHGDTQRCSISGGMSVPVCGKLTIRGASRCSTVSQLGVAVISSPSASLSPLAGRGLG